jgi:zinc protease
MRAFCAAAMAALALGTAVFAQASAPTTQSASQQAASAHAAPSADQILDKYLVASGGRAAWQKLSSRVSKGTVDLPALNLSGTVEMREKAPNRLVVTVTMSGFVFSQGFDGTVGWSNDPQNGLREQKDGELRETKREADFYHPLDFRQLYSKISVGGTEKLGERSAYVVQATPPEGGEPDKVYFDVETGLPLRAIIQHHNPDGDVEEFQEDFEDYRTVDGIKIPFTIHQSNAQAAFTIKIEDVRHNVELDDAQFAKPAVQ